MGGKVVTKKNNNTSGLKPFKKGQSGNPGGRPKVERDIKWAFREHSKDAMETLLDICRDKKASTTARVSAAQTILDRGWGKATQHVEAKVGPLDELSTDDKRALLEAINALSGSEGDTATDAGERTH